MWAVPYRWGCTLAAYNHRKLDRHEGTRPLHPAISHHSCPVPVPRSFGAASHILIVTASCSSII